MPRKKSDKASQTVDGLETSVKPLEETENTSSNSDSTPINGDTSVEALKEQVDDKPKKKRKSVPKRIIHIVLDAGRSRIKVVGIYESEQTEVIVLDSLVCETDYTPNGEIGSFTLGKTNPNAPKGKKASELTPEEKENKKDIVSHWVVGTNARYQSKPFVSMTEGDEHKIKYFPVLALGAIASLPDLYELSTGVNEKNRSLTVRLTTLSLANPYTLKQSLQDCKWLKIDGIKYRINFGTADDFAGFPEGYGGALYFKALKNEAKVFLVFDIGFGTATITEYSNLGKLPKRGMCNPNGGGGIAGLIREFAEVVAQVDSSKSIKPSQLKEILEGSQYENEKVIAIAPDGRDIGKQLELAIGHWIKDSPVTFALEKLAIMGRRSPVVCCGGGFAIPPVRQMVVQELKRVGVPEENLIVPDSPGLVALSEMKRLYNVGGDKDEQQQAA